MPGSAATDIWIVGLLLLGDVAGPDGRKPDRELLLGRRVSRVHCRHARLPGRHHQNTRAVSRLPTPVRP
jgi:hypothetical protein